MKVSEGFSARQMLIEALLLQITSKSDINLSEDSAPRALQTVGIVRSSNIATNVFSIAEGGVLLAQRLNRRPNVDPRTNVLSKPFSAAFGNTLLAAIL